MFTPQELELLKPLQYQHPLLPIGADRKGMRKKKKAPVNKNGFLLSGWTRHEGFTTKELWSHPHAIAIGVRCDSLFCLDIDGATASDKAGELSLAEGEPTWEVRRDTNSNYWKRIFAPTPEQFFCSAGRQVIVIGDHYESGGRYYWPEGRTPENLRSPTVDEWSKVLRLLKQYSGESLPTPSVITKNKTDWQIMDECEICGRCERQVCSISADNNVISCFHGLTYAPPKGLKRGELVNGKWGYSKTQERSFGTFSIFVRHKPSQQELLQRRLFSVV